MKQFIFTGHTTKDLELKTSQKGKLYAVITLAINSYNSSTKQAEVEFYDVSIFDKSAENLAKHVGKGSNLMIQGIIKKTFTTAEDGKKTYYTNFIARTVEVSNRKNPAGYEVKSETEQQIVDNQINGFEYPIEEDTEY